ncbi:MAG: hypothetical protein ABEI77_07180 [Halorientalis sp.]
MTEDMLSRRRLLAIAATTVTAGCGGRNNSQNDQSGRFATNETTAGAGTSTTTTTRQTETANSVEIDIETKTQAEPEPRPDQQPRTEQSTETTETATPTGAALLRKAKDELNQSLTTYIDIEDVDSIVELDASNTEFDENAVRKHLKKATRHLDDAELKGGVSEQNVAQLRTAREAIAKLVDCQAAIVTTYEKFDDAYDALFDEKYGTVTRNLSQMDLYRSKTKDRRKAFKRSVSPADFEPVDGFSADDYDVKLDQFATEIDSFDQVKSPITKLNGGVRKFSDAVEWYVDKSYETAYQKFLESQNGFEQPSTTFMRITVADAIRKQVEILQSTANGLAKGTNHMLKSCRSGENDNEENRRERLYDAMRKYGRSGHVSQLPSYQYLSDNT